MIGERRSRLPDMRLRVLATLSLTTIVFLRAEGHAGPSGGGDIAPAPAAAIERARANGVQFEQAVAASRRLLHRVA